MAFESRERIGDCRSNCPLDSANSNRTSTFVERVPSTKLNGESANLGYASTGAEASGGFDLVHDEGDDAMICCSKSLSNHGGLFPGCRSITDLPAALIAEILNCLDPKDLGIVSCVSTALCKLASDHDVWKDFYCERWGLPVSRPLTACSSDDRTWKDLFVEREFRSRIFLGWYRRDFLSGHTEAVRAVFLLASAKLIFTCGYDSVVRVWDMEEGSSISSSRPLGCTIRAVAADTKLLIAGGTDGFIHCWKAVEGLPHLFDLTESTSPDSEFRLWEHEGPITCLALDMARIYSGSWDMTVRVWDRALLKCTVVLRHGDWVWSLAPHDSSVVSSSGPDVYVWDTRDKTLMALIPHAHVGNTFALARTQTGDFVFTGGEDGSIHMFQISDCVEKGAFKIATWIPHSGSVHSLAFEFPWLVSASSDGKLALIDVRKLLKNSRRSLTKHCPKRKQAGVITVEPPQRMLHCSGGSLYSVDIGADCIVCGGEECSVRIWDFSQALEKEQRSLVQRMIRLENRMRHSKLKLEMSSKGIVPGQTDRCSVVAKKNTINGDRVWHTKRGVSGKLKA